MADDIGGLIRERGAETAMLVGHDWGGTLAWTLAMNHPEVVDRLAVLNAAHPRKLSQGLHHPGQLRRSWYFFFFDLPDLPESVVHANNWHYFRHFLRDARPAFTPEETDRYVEAWSQPGAATGMINYYRSSVRTPPKKAEAAIHPIQAPTLVIWGEADHYLNPDLAEPDHDDVPHLDRVERLDGASHWVHHDEAERVTQLLVDFFSPALQARNSPGIEQAASTPATGSDARGFRPMRSPHVRAPRR
jgi:pimeloyl-ACP methyl ester carboxylesterase